METRAHAPLPVYLSPKGPVSLTVAGTHLVSDSHRTVCPHWHFLGYVPPRVLPAVLAPLIGPVAAPSCLLTFPLGLHP